MKKFTIVVETGLDIVTLAKKIEDITYDNGVNMMPVKLKSILEVQE